MRAAQCRHAGGALQIGSVTTHLGVATTHGPKTIEGKMNLIRNYRNWRRYRDTVKELSRLSNRELNDLGITRSEIEAVAQRTL
jgi:uncharacterized protein YjiS (DUF1127 family)